MRISKHDAQHPEALPTPRPRWKWKHPQRLTMAIHSASPRSTIDSGQWRPNVATLHIDRLRSPNPAICHLASFPTRSTPPSTRFSYSKPNRTPHSKEAHSPADAKSSKIECSPCYERQLFAKGMRVKKNEKVLKQKARGKACKSMQPQKRKGRHACAVGGWQRR